MSSAPMRNGTAMVQRIRLPVNAALAPQAAGVWRAAVAWRSPMRTINLFAHAFRYPQATMCAARSCHVAAPHAHHLPYLVCISLAPSFTRRRQGVRRNSVARRPR